MPADTLGKARAALVQSSGLSEDQLDQAAELWSAREAGSAAQLDPASQDVSAARILHEHVVPSDAMAAARRR